MKELAVCVSNDNKNVSVYETIDAIKKAGFKNVFIQWYDEDWNISQEEQLKYIKDNDLNVIFVHLGYQNINDLWIEDETNIVDRYKKDILNCSLNGVSLVIMYLTSKFEAPNASKIGLIRIKEILDYAKNLGVRVAFENTKIEGYLEYVFDNIDNDNMGICLDSGHYHAFFKDELDFDKFKNKIFAVHLHDNFGVYDEHLLPFDGTVNWDNIISNLHFASYEGPITLEICYHAKYLNMSIEDFYKLGYITGEKLLKKFNGK